MPDTKSKRVDGRIGFYANHVPPLNAGQYRLQIEQTLFAEVKPKFSREVHFAVAGDRYRLLPNEVSNRFPPADGVGNFANVLPHIVLARKTLPWERTASGGPTWRDASGDVAPWLALLVLDGANSAAVRSVRVADLFHAADLPNDAATVVSTSSLAADQFTSFSGKPSTRVLEVHESLQDVCDVIDLPLATFNAVAPAASELALLAHARRLTLAAAGGDAQTTDFAVVVANRLPQVGQRSRAVLVSLEGLALALPQADDQPGQWPENAQRIRLVVLDHWSFEVQLRQGQKGQAFAQLIADLNQGHATDSLLRHGGYRANSGNAKVDHILAQGYTGLPHVTRLGDHLVSWYRGPFMPSPSKPASLPLPATSADALNLYDDSQGMFDISYASAWQLGRLLALNNKAFATGLFSWKRERRKAASDRLVQQHLHALAPHLETPAEEDAKLDLVRRVVVDCLRNALARSQQAAAVVPPRGLRLQQRQAAIRQVAQVQALHGAEPAIPEGIVQWLKRLSLLHGVPFDYLVPHESLLPPESIRFFRLDADWHAALLDGATSIGRMAALDQHDAAFAPTLMARVRAAAGITQTHEVSGFLLRSDLVDGWWPGLRIEAHASTQSPAMPQDKLKPLRADRLGPSVLLCLFDGAVQRVDLHPPPQAIHYGLTVENSDASGAPIRFVKDLRDLASGVPLFDAAGQAKAASVAFRASRGVLRVAELHQAMASQTGVKNLDAAQFAAQMIEGTQMGGFIHAGPSEGPSP